MLTEEQNNRAIRELDEVKEVAQELRDAAEPYHHLMNDKSQVVRTRLDKLGDRQVISLWKELVDRFYELIEIDQPNEYATWYGEDDLDTPSANFAIDLSDLMVSYTSPSRMWLMTLDDILYDKLPKALDQLEKIIDRHQPRLF